MNNFEKIIAAEYETEGLFSDTIEMLQVNLGLKCNQQCLHCHLECSPERNEMMEWSIMEMVLKAVDSSHCGRVDLTGGAPELNPFFRRFVRALREKGCLVQVRTNLTILLDAGFDDLPGFFREQGVQLVASLPCYTKENVCAQRGAGVFEKSIEAIRRLNTLGYGHRPITAPEPRIQPWGAISTIAPAFS